ncbi:MAG: carboxypeptidase-like regulatory domain-containing protein [Myxococcota bacterium]
MVWAWLGGDSRPLRAGAAPAGAAERSEGREAVSGEEPPVGRAAHTGVVVDGAGRPVAEAEVRWWEDRVRTDADGRFTLPFAVRAPSRIRAEHPVHGVGETVETYNSRPEERVRIELHRVTRLRGRVQTTDGAAIRKGHIGWEFYREGKRWSGTARLAPDGSVVSDPFFTRFRRHVYMRFYSQSHERVETVVVLEPGRDTDFGVLTARPIPPAARLSGRVVGRLAKVNVIKPGARVAADGSFSTAWDLLPGPLRPEWNGFGAEGERLIAIGPPLTLEAGEHRRAYEIREQEPASLEGVVVDHEGTPQPLTTVVVSTRSAFGVRELRRERRGGHVQSDREGRFRIDQLVSGPYLVAVPHARFLQREVFSIDAIMEPLRVELAPGANRVELRMPDPRFVRGSVKVVPGLRGTILGAEKRPLVIDENGRFEFERTGVEAFAIEAEGYRWLEVRLSGDRYMHYAGLQLGRGTFVEGVVEGAPGAMVSFFREILPNIEAKVDADGRFLLEGIPYGPVGLSVTAPGHRSQWIEYDTYRPKILRVRFGTTPAPPPTDPR